MCFIVEEGDFRVRIDAMGWCVCGYVVCVYGLILILEMASARMSAIWNLGSDASKEGSRRRMRR
jgi:hypothetical protein